MSATKFPVLDRYMGLRIGVDFSALKPGKPVVVEWPEWPMAPQRTVFHWLWLDDGRSATAVPPGFRDEFASIVAGTRGAETLLEPALIEKIRPVVDRALAQSGMDSVRDENIFQAPVFGCSPATFKKQDRHQCQRLTDRSLPVAAGVKLPDVCTPEGIAYGVVVDGKVVSVAFSRDTGAMRDEVAVVSVHTSPAWGGRGYGTATVSRVIEHVVSSGGEAVYRCRADNEPSLAIARSVGCIPYGKYIML